MTALTVGAVETKRIAINSVDLDSSQSGARREVAGVVVIDDVGHDDPRVSELLLNKLHIYVVWTWLD